MKKIILAFLLAAGVALGAAAQDKKSKEVREADVPQAVKDRFGTQFAGATDVDWKMKDTYYTASFDYQSADHHAKFTTAGEIVSWGKKIAESEVPAAVVSAVARDFAGYKIDEAYTVMEAGKTDYKLELDGKTDRKVIYSADGKLLKDKLDD